MNLQLGCCQKNRMKKILIGIIQNIKNIIGRECINTFLGKSIFLVPENQQVMVGSLGFFDLIFVFRKRLNICCRSIHHISAQLVGSI